MKKFVVLLFVSVLCLLPAFSNAIEVEDEEGGVWAVFITDQNAAIPSVQNLVDEGIDINPESAVVTEYETFEEGLVRLSSAIAEKMVSILYDFGPGSYMGVYQYDGAEGKYAIAAFVPENKRTTLDNLASFFIGSLEYDSAVMSFEEMIES